MPRTSGKRLPHAYQRDGGHHSAGTRRTATTPGRATAFSTTAGADETSACPAGETSAAAAAVAGAALESGTLTITLGSTAVPCCCVDGVAGKDCATAAGDRGDASGAAGATGPWVLPARADVASVAPGVCAGAVWACALETPTAPPRMSPTVRRVLSVSARFRISRTPRRELSCVRFGAVWARAEVPVMESNASAAKAGMGSRRVMVIESPQVAVLPTGPRLTASLGARAIMPRSLQSVPYRIVRQCSAANNATAERAGSRLRGRTDQWRAEPRKTGIFLTVGRYLAKLAKSQRAAVETLATSLSTFAKGRTVTASPFNGACLCAIRPPIASPAPSEDDRPCDGHPIRTPQSVQRFHRGRTGCRAAKARPFPSPRRASCHKVR